MATLLSGEASIFQGVFALLSKSLFWILALIFVAVLAVRIHVHHSRPHANGFLVEVGNPNPPENCEFVAPLVLHISAKHELRLNQEPIARDHLSARLGLILKERIRPRLYVDADSEITMQEFAQILDLVRDSSDKTEIRLITQGNRKYSCVDVPTRLAA